MRTTGTQTLTLEVVIRLSLGLLLVVGGAQVVWWGYEDTTDIPAPTVSVNFEIYVHDIPRGTVPRSAVAFQTLSQQERDIFLAAYMSLDNNAETSIRNPPESPFSHLSQAAYVRYHDRWFGITTDKSVNRIPYPLPVDLAGVLLTTAGILLALVGVLILADH
jgi:hypothetical protein